jgi:hypothetical protein
VIALLFYDGTNRRVGTLSLVAAIGIVAMMRVRKKKRAKSSAEGQESVKKAENPFDAPGSQLGVTTQISASSTRSNPTNPMSSDSAPSLGEDPFLTPSEKAIISRVTSRDGETKVGEANVSKPLTHLVV